MTDDLGRELVDWIVATALESADEQALIDGFCARLNEAGFNLVRAFVASEILHPLHDARGVVWRGNGAARENYGDETNPEHDAEWQRSPLHYVIQNELQSLRLRLDDTLEPGRFPLLQELRDEGGTDYVAHMRNFGAGTSYGAFHGVVASWTTRRPGGYTNAQIVVLDRCMTALALAFKSSTTFDTGRILMRTYLGHDAGERVVAGEIRRGEPQAIDAVLWSSDLRGFTRLANTVTFERTALCERIRAVYLAKIHIIYAQIGLLQCILTGLAIRLDKVRIFT